jgi:hypothetical protein
VGVQSELTATNTSLGVCDSPIAWSNVPAVDSGGITFGFDSRNVPMPKNLKH